MEETRMEMDLMGNMLPVSTDLKKKCDRACLKNKGIKVGSRREDCLHPCSGSCGQLG